MSALPKGWAMARLADVAQWGSGGTPSRKNDAYFNGHVPWVKTGELGQGIIVDTEEKLTELGVKNSSAKVFPKGSVVIAMYGATIGKTAILGIDATTNQACAVGIPFENLISTKFLYHYLLSQKQAFIDAGKGGAQPNISQTIIKNWPIPLPPLAEQQRIADKLDALLARVDACRARLGRMPALLKRFRQAVLAAAVAGRLTEDWREENGTGRESPSKLNDMTGFDYPDAGVFGDYAFPASWKAQRLGEIAEITSGITKDAKKQDTTFEELPYLRVANVQRGYLDLAEMKTIRVPPSRVDEMLLVPGDMLFTEGGDRDKLGRGWVWSGEIERCIFQNHIFRARLHEPMFNPKYFSWYGNSQGLDYFLASGKQTTNLASINRSMLAALPVAVPPAAEQHEIVRRVETLFAYADRLEARLAAAQARVAQLTPSLLAKAFRGELGNAE